MPTGERWGKGNGNEMLEFERFLNEGEVAQLTELAAAMRQPGADLIETYARVAHEATIDPLFDAIRANWFGIHSQPERAGRPMWASNAVLSPQQAHAVMLETFARAAGWVAGDRDGRRLRVWCRCGEPELQTWLLTPTTASPSIGHLFVATPYNSGYPATDDDGPPTGYDLDRRTAARELLVALVELTGLRPGDSIGAHLRAADRVATARSAFGPASTSADNQLFEALCHHLVDPLDGSQPPFVGTGLACRMGADGASVEAVAATGGTYDAPPGSERHQSARFRREWRAGTYDGVRLRYARG